MSKWTSPTTEERIALIRSETTIINDFIQKSSTWHRDGDGLDNLEYTVQGLTRKIMQLRAHLGRCQRGHVTGPDDNKCMLCGARKG